MFVLSFIYIWVKKTDVIVFTLQLMVATVIGPNGRNAVSRVAMEFKQKPELVLNQPQLMEAKIVHHLEQIQKPKCARKRNAKVISLYLIIYVTVNRVHSFFYKKNAKLSLYFHFQYEFLF